MSLRFRLVNVFARPGEPFSGNPLCVCEDSRMVEDDPELASAQMQALARQFNLSETTFILPTPSGEQVPDVTGIRIFTTGFEMPFAGHPTLGTAHVVRDLRQTGDDVLLSMPAGVIPVHGEGDHWTLTARRGVVEADLDGAELAAALGLGAGDLVGPVQQVSVGTSQVIARAADVAAVRRARVDPARLGGFAGMGGPDTETLVYLYAETGDGELEARGLISDGSSVSEDPATGSACANLGTYLAAQGRSGEWTVHQGAQVARPSLLRLRVEDDGTVRVGGLVRDVGRVTVDLGDDVHTGRS